MTDAKQFLKDAIQNPEKYGVNACIVCGGKPGMVGLFTPTESFGKRIGQPIGKQRIVVYAICDTCQERPNWVDAVEAALVRKMGTQ